MIIMFSLSVYSEKGSAGLYTYYIGHESTVSIHGTTNVNTFECVSERDLPRGYIIAEHYPEEQLMLFSDASLELEVSSFDCSNRIMNKDFRQALGGDSYPYIVIRLLETRLDKRMQDDAGFIIATVEIMIKQKTVEKEVPVKLSAPGNLSFHAEGSVSLSMSEFGIEAPSPALGIVKVDDELKVRFRLSIGANVISGGI